MGLFDSIVKEIVKAPFDVVKGASDGLSEGIKQITEPKEKS